MLHESIFLATRNATMTNKKPFKLQRGCYTQATCPTTLRKVEGRSTFLATRSATIVVAKWGVTREFFLATCNATFVTLRVARKIASCNIALSANATRKSHCVLSAIALYPATHSKMFIEQKFLVFIGVSSSPKWKISPLKDAYLYHPRPSAMATYTYPFFVIITLTYSEQTVNYPNTFHKPVRLRFRF